MTAVLLDRETAEQSLLDFLTTLDLDAQVDVEPTAV